MAANMFDEMRVERPGPSPCTVKSKQQSPIIGQRIHIVAGQKLRGGQVKHRCPRLKFGRLDHKKSEKLPPILASERAGSIRAENDGDPHPPLRAKQLPNKYIASKNKWCYDAKHIFILHL